MSKTIKQLADELGVSKTAVRNYMTEEFREKHTEKDCKGVILVSADGCKLIAESFGKTENNRKENSETELCTIPRSVLTMLEEQLQAKDEQLAAKDAQIADLTATVRAQSESLHAEQALHAGTMQKQLALEDGSKKWWQFWKKGE